jgi:hypothetical protein
MLIQETFDSISPQVTRFSCVPCRVVIAMIVFAYRTVAVAVAVAATPVEELVIAAIVAVERLESN